MGVHYLNINGNKAYITKELINEINQKDNEKLEELQFRIQIATLANEIKLFAQEIKFTKLIFSL